MAQNAGQVLCAFSADCLVDSCDVDIVAGPNDHAGGHGCQMGMIFLHCGTMKGGFPSTLPKLGPSMGTCTAQTETMDSACPAAGEGQTCMDTGSTAIQVREHRHSDQGAALAPYRHSALSCISLVIQVATSIFGVWIIAVLLHGSVSPGSHLH